MICSDFMQRGTVLTVLLLLCLQSSLSSSSDHQHAPSHSDSSSSAPVRLFSVFFLYFDVIFFKFMNALRCSPGVSVGRHCGANGAQG